MSGEFSFEFPQAESERMFAEMQRAQRTLGISMRGSVAWAGSLLAQSLGARTKLSEKKRVMVDNPNPSSDRRRAPFGTMVWRNGEQVFKPVWRTGKAGSHYYASKEEAKNDRRLIIGRRGLAKKSWTWMKNTNRNASATIMGARNVSSTDWSGGVDNPTLTITNELRYMQHALIGGSGALSGAITAATNRLHHEINRKAAKAFGLT